MAFNLLTFDRELFAEPDLAENTNHYNMRHHRSRSWLSNRQLSTNEKQDNAIRQLVAKIKALLNTSKKDKLDLPTKKSEIRVPFLSNQRKRPNIDSSHELYHLSRQYGCQWARFLYVDKIPEDLEKSLQKPFVYFDAQLWLQYSRLQSRSRDSVQPKSSH